MIERLGGGQRCECDSRLIRCQRDLWGAKVVPVGPRRGQPRLLHAYHVRQVLPTEILEQRVLIVRLAKPSQQRVRVPGDEAQWISLLLRLGD